MIVVFISNAQADGTHFKDIKYEIVACKPTLTYEEDMAVFTCENGTVYYVYKRGELMSGHWELHVVTYKAEVKDNDKNRD